MGDTVYQTPQIQSRAFNTRDKTQPFSESAQGHSTRYLLYHVLFCSVLLQTPGPSPSLALGEYRARAATNRTGTRGHHQGYPLARYDGICSKEKPLVQSALFAVIILGDIVSFLTGRDLQRHEPCILFCFSLFDIPIQLRYVRF